MHRYMKKFILTVLVLVPLMSRVNGQIEDALVRDCSNSAGPDVTYLKDFVADLEGVSSDEKQLPAKFSVILNKNTEYRFTVCNSDSKPGKGMIQLYDTERLLGSSFNASTGKEYKSFNFCAKRRGCIIFSSRFRKGNQGLQWLLCHLPKRCNL